MLLCLNLCFVPASYEDCVAAQCSALQKYQTCASAYVLSDPPTCWPGQDSALMNRENIPFDVQYCEQWLAFH